MKHQAPPKTLKLSCEQLEVVRDLAINDSKILRSPDWSIHLNNCNQCAEEVRLLNDSLSVYRQVETMASSNLLTGDKLDSVEKLLFDVKAKNKRYKISNIKSFALAVAVLFLVGFFLGRYSIEQQIFSTEQEIALKANLNKLKLSKLKNEDQKKLTYIEPEQAE